MDETPTDLGWSTWARCVLHQLSDGETARTENREEIKDLHGELKAIRDRLHALEKQQLKDDHALEKQHIQDDAAAANQITAIKTEMTVTARKEGGIWGAIGGGGIAAILEAALFIARLFF